MKNFKKIAYASAGLSLLAVNNVNAAVDLGANSWNTTGITQWTPLIETIRSWLVTILTLVGFVAVVYWLWGWFNILTAGWDDEKVKKGKKVIINALIWIAVIFIVGMLVNWLISLLGSNVTTG